MKKMIAALVAGIILGSTGVALGQSYWSQGGATYSCEGTRLTVKCVETNWSRNYEVWIMPSRVGVFYGDRPLFGCKRKLRPDAGCTAFVG